MSDTAVIHGVTIRRHESEAAVWWQWETPARYGVTVHSMMVWVRSTGKWRRGTSIVDKHEKGGWQDYPALYPEAKDEEQAWTFVKKHLEGELGRASDYP